MNLNWEEVPIKNLAPKLKRPLSLWNPLDYFRILFWFLFFPQAIRFYLEKYKRSIYQYKLFFQAITINSIITSVICAILKPFHFKIHWLLNASEIILVVWFYAALAVAVGAMRGWDKCVSIGVAAGVTVGVVVGVTIGGRENLIPAYAFVYVCIFAGLSGDKLIVVEFEEEKSVVRTKTVLGYVVSRSEGLNFYTPSVVGIMLFGSTLGLVPLLLIFGEANFLVVLFMWVVINSIYLLTPFHLIEYLITVIYLAFFPKWQFGVYRLPQMCRLVLQPIPDIQMNLGFSLHADWEYGIHEAYQVLTYSRQFVPVVKAIRHRLDQFPDKILLSRISAMITNIYDWKLIPAILQNQVELPWKSISTPSLNKYATAACEGFWFWHNKKTMKAEDAFFKVRNLRHGLELYQIALAINQGTKAISLHSIASLEKEINKLDDLPDTKLRADTIRTLRLLHAAAGKAHIAAHSQSTFIRSTAVREAVDNLNKLIYSEKPFCPEPEWPLIRDIALKWRLIFNSTRETIGEELFRIPSLNPYEGYSRLPVTGSTFSGRSRVMEQIDTHLASDGLKPVIVLYGYRGMGKSSLLRYLAKNNHAKNIYVYLDMQIVVWVDHAGQILLYIADAVHKSLSQYGFDMGPVTDVTLYSDLNTSICSFNLLLDRIAPNMTGIKRFILAIDEFELIENGIHDGKLDPGLLFYLRSINQQYRWFGLIFAGQHTLEEMGRDYQSAFYGQAQYIHVSCLTRDDALKLITQPHPDFSLEYDEMLIDEIYRLTFGQPYLVQLLCWELVNRWNDRFLEKGPIPRILIPGDLEPVLTPAFYQSAGYYFEGVWGNATENEQTLLHLLSRYPNPLSQKELETAALSTGFPPDPEIIKETLKLLSQHDIITQSEKGIGFASELMRRWVQQQN